MNYESDALTETGTEHYQPNICEFGVGRGQVGRLVLLSVYVYANGIVDIWHTEECHNSKGDNGRGTAHPLLFGLLLS